MMKFIGGQDVDHLLSEPPQIFFPSSSNDFFSVITESPAFWTQAVGFGLAAICGVFLALMVLRAGMRRRQLRLQRLRALHADVRGVAAIMDFTLVMPIFIMVILLTLQLALMANASIMVHYAAYSAARAAKTQLVDFDHAFLDLDCCYVDVANKSLGVMNALALLNGGGGIVQERVFAAAAWPLVALAPSSRQINVSATGPGGTGQSGNGNSHDRIDDLGLRTMLQKQMLRAGRTELLLRKATYAYSDAYLRVDYGSPLFNAVKELWEQRSSSPSLSQIASALGENAHYAAIGVSLGEQLESSGYSVTSITSLPVYAEVQFYFPLLVPWASFFFDQDNLVASHPGRWLSARVDLL